MADIDPVEAAKSLLPRWLREDPTLMASWEEGVGAVGYQDALAYVRQTPTYAVRFPGMMREDGTQRFDSENDYIALIESYERDLEAVGVNPDVMRHIFVDLIEEDVSSDEFWSERVKPMYDRVIRYGDDLMARYAADHDLEMTPEALIAAALDPQLETKLFDKSIALTEIKAASDRVFGMEETNRWASLMEDLGETQGFGATQAQQLFQRAGHLIPTLEILNRRHQDPDDEFDLGDFTAASFFEDPSQTRRIRRLVSQEQSLFADTSAALRRDQRTGGVAGIAAS